jgi:hypothetical protein
LCICSVDCVDRRAGTSFQGCRRVIWVSTARHVVVSVAAMSDHR